MLVKMEERVKGSIESEQQQESKPEPAQQPILAVNMDDDTMAAYERKRFANIQRNLEFMQTMGLSSVRV